MDLVGRVQSIVYDGEGRDRVGQTKSRRETRERFGNNPVSTVTRH